MTEAEIISGLKEVIAKVKPGVDTTSITKDTLLVEDLAIDSLSLLMLSLATEQKFGMQFGMQINFRTVGDVVDYIVKVL